MSKFKVGDPVWAMSVSVDRNVNWYRLMAGVVTEVTEGGLYGLNYDYTVRPVRGSGVYRCKECDLSRRNTPDHTITKAPEVQANTGHMDDGSGIQKHSAGSIFPFGVFAFDTPTGLSWGVFGPSFDGMVKLYAGYEFAYSIAELAANLYKEQKMRDITSARIAANNAKAAATVPDPAPARATDSVKKGQGNVVTFPSGKPFLRADDFHIGHENPIFPWVEFRHGSDSLLYGAQHPTRGELRGFVTQSGLHAAITRLGVDA